MKSCASMSKQSDGSSPASSPITDAAVSAICNAAALIRYEDHLRLLYQVGFSTWYHGFTDWQWLTQTYPQEPLVSAQVRDVANRLSKKMDITTNPVLKAFLAGSFSGTCSTVLFQPLDPIKTRIQNTATNAEGKSTLRVSLPRPGMVKVARQVMATEHVSGLWRGMSPSITRTVPGVGLYFGSLHWMKSSICDGSPTALQAVGLGMGARSVAATVMIPVTVLKTRFESGQFNYTRMTTALVTIYKSEGTRGLTRGLLPTLARDAPYSGLYLMFYTQLKKNLVVPRCLEDTEHGAVAHFLCGMAAGFLASLVTHPADVVKTKMQISPDVYSSLTGTSRQIFTALGPRGFLVGFAPRMIRRALVSSCAWTIYEEITNKLGLK